MPTSINVYLDHPDIVYFPGQTITGRIELSNTSPKNCRGVKVKFRGYSKVHWSEQKTDGDKTVTKHYRSGEEYYNTKYYVWGDGSETELPPGEHTYNFSHVLAPSLPSSFESEYGKVRHEVKAALDLPMAFDKEASKFFSVSSLYDLNTIPGVTDPVHSTETTHLCCWCCKSGPISVVFNTAKTGFVSGENMFIDAECTNMSNRVMDKTKAKITQKIKYYAEGKSKSKTRKVASVEHPAIPAGESNIWSAVPLKIPPLVPSQLPGCQNIRVTYDFEFSMDPGSCAMNLDINFPITIGTIPLRSTHQSIRAPPGGVVPTVPPPAAWVPPNPYSQPGDEKTEGHPDYPSAPGAPPAYPGPPGPPAPEAPLAPVAPPEYPGAPGAPPGYPPPGAAANYPGGPSAPPLGFPGLVNYPDMPPPSYDECVFGPHSEDSDDESSDKKGGKFAPKYVTYGFQ